MSHANADYKPVDTTSWSNWESDGDKTFDAAKQCFRTKTGDFTIKREDCGTDHEFVCEYRGSRLSLEGAAAQAPDVGCTETVSYSIPVVQTAYVTLTPDVQTEHVTLTPEIRTEYVTVTPQVQLHQDIRHFRRNLDINPDTEVQQESDKQ
nr:hypothetical protein BaRGS_012358 [Batillaria attramentaria]